MSPTGSARCSQPGARPTAVYRLALALILAFAARLAVGANPASMLGQDSTGDSTITQLPGVTFFVSTAGKDSWSGTLPSPNSHHTDGPFASISRAQSAVRSLRKAHPSSPVTVLLRGGTYYLPLSGRTLNFTSKDSGSPDAPVTWHNYPSEVPVLSGGVPVTSWNHVSGALWRAKIPSSLQPFEYLFYNGQRRTRSRLQSQGGVGYYVHGGSCISTENGQTVSMSLCDLGTFLRIAAEVPPTGANSNCPSVTDGPDSKCLDRFQYDPGDPVAQWINLNPSKGNQCGQKSSGSYPSGDIELTLFDAWTVDIMRISCVDTNKHIIYLTGATQGVGTSYPYFGPTAGHRYVIENTLDAFNAEQAAGQTGIWFLDRSTSPWTLNYLANYGENPNSDTVVIPQLGGAIPGDPATDYIGASLFFADGLQNVTVSGLTFEVDNFIPSSTGFNNDGNEEFAVPQMIDCESCQNVIFDSITVRHTSGSGILVAGTGGHEGAPAANDTVQNSAFYDLGSSGIRVGHTPSGTDRYQYVAQFLTIQNNLIQGYSRIFADGEGVAMGNGHDVLIQHNDINDGYHSGISICTLGCYSSQWSANGINIVSQYNHLWNMMQGLTSDNGGLYYNVGSANGAGTGDQILNNLIHDVSDASVIDQNITGSGYGGHGIYLDMQSAGMQIANNVVYNISASGVAITGGPGPKQLANTVNNNIVAYSRKSAFMEQYSWPQNCTYVLRANITHNLFYFDLDSSTGFYPVLGCADSCGMSYNQYQNFQGNLFWRTDGGFGNDPNAFFVLNTTPPPKKASQCGGSSQQNPDQYTPLTFSQWQNGHPIVNGQPLAMNEDQKGTASVDPGFGSSGQPTDFLLSNAPLPGFSNDATNDTINNAGRNNPQLTAPVVPATFPTYYFSNF